MKKFLFSAAILASFASCSTMEVNDLVKSSDLISFSTLNDRVTTKSATENGDSYQVYSSYNSTTTNYTSIAAWYFTDEVSDADVSTNIHYWPTDNSALDFYAFAPASQNTNVTESVDAGVPSLTIDYTVTEAANEDFTVAEAVTNKTTSTVDLKFSHKLTKVKFVVELSQTLLDAGYELDEDTYSVNFTVAHNGGKMDVTTGDWSSSDVKATEITHTGAQSYYIYPQETTNSGSAVGSIIEVTGISVYGTDASGDKETLATVNDVTLYPYEILTGNITDDEFAENTYYTITFTIDGSSVDEDGETIIDDELIILFTSSFVSDWTTNEDSDDLAAISVSYVKTSTETKTYTVADGSITYDLDSFIYSSTDGVISGSALAMSGDDLTYDVTVLLAYFEETSPALTAGSTNNTMNSLTDNDTYNQTVTTTVYLVNGNEYTVVTYGTPEKQV